MDERYQRGKIYTIRCRYDTSKIYVGSTIQTLSHRMCDHLSLSLRKAYKLYNEVSVTWRSRHPRRCPPFWAKRSSACDVPAATLYTLIKCFYHATPWEITTGMRLKLLLLDYPLSSGDPVICCVDQASLFFFLSVGSCPSLPHSRRARVSNKQSNSRLISFLQL